MTLTGRNVSHYQVHEELSRGGMGVVYRATDTRLKRDVALKVLPPDLVSNADRRQRFVREARAASTLEHPSIAVIYDVGEDDGISFIVMELIRGGKLSDAIAEGQFSRDPSRVLDLAVEIAEALARAHDQGIVHRDLKPDNVMLTEDGHAKVIDFGLAKLIAPLDHDDTVTAAMTETAVVMGTVHYMSPEQARGGAIDHRTDVFSFGVLLFEMFSGTRPFKGDSGIDTLHAIIHDDPLPLHLKGSGPVSPVAAEFQRIIKKCLSKDPASRYQGMRDLIVDLKAARRRADSSTAPTVELPAAPPPGKSRWLVGLAAIAVLLVVGGWIWSNNSRAPVVEATSADPSVAVLYFENNTGNASLDWLRTGLTDMLVTDLSQSPDVEVLSTDRLVQILGEIGKLDDRTISFETVQEVARRGRVKNVLLGSYVKAGEAIRINVRLQDAATGRIISTERVDAVNEAGLFPTMDDLTKRVKARFLIPAGRNATNLLAPPGTSAPAVLDRDLSDVTTTSMEAYRHYAAGIEQHQRSRFGEALTHFERAVQIDSNFALAYVKMAVASSNMGRSNDRDKYAERALSLVGRLTPRERFYIEGYYLSSKIETTGRGIEAYEKAVEMYPDHSSSRNNLAVLYMRSDQLDKAIEHFTILRERGFDFPGTAGNLASAYIGQGEYNTGLAVIKEFAARFPDLEAAHNYVGMMSLASNRLDDATAAFEKTLALRPDFALAHAGLAQIAIEKDDFERAQRLASILTGASQSTVRHLGELLNGYAEVYRGHTRDAQRRFAAAAQVLGEGSNESAFARVVVAEIHLAHGDRDAAIAEATRAVTDARGRVSAVDGYLTGSMARSPALRSEYQRLADSLPFGSDKVLPLLADAVVAVEDGRHRQALEWLQKVDAALPPGPIAAGALGAVRQPRGMLMYWRGRAYLGDGNLDAAEQEFTKLVNSGFVRLYTPFEYVRAHYHLGQIAEKKRNGVAAREHYSRFLSYWRDGDIDRDKVAEAVKKVS